MSSKAFINVMAALTLARFCAEVTLKDTSETSEDQKIRRVCKRIRLTVAGARGYWQPCSAKDVAQICERIKFLGDDILTGPREITEIIAVTLGLLNDIEPLLRRAKREMIGRLIGHMENLNREFDRRLENENAYVFAGRAVDRWYGDLGVDHD